MAYAYFAGRFTLTHFIGQGGTGTVWVAYDHRLDKECAVKLIQHVDADALLRVVNEQRVRLAHPHLVCPYAWVADEDVLIAMDLVRGGSLTTLIRDYGPIPARYTAMILAQLLDALDHIHRSGYLHRDVKPANVLLEVTGKGPPHIRLADFGLALATATPRLTQTGYIVGTPGYLPPEAIAGAPPDRLLDLYATGIVGWQLLTGSEEPAPVEEWGPPPRALVGLWELLRSLAAPDPRQRPPDAATAARTLAEVTVGLPGGFPALCASGEPIEVFDVIAALCGDAPLPATPPPHATSRPSPALTAGRPRPLPDTRPPLRWTVRGRRWASLTTVVLTLVALIVGTALYVNVSGTGPPSASPLKPATTPSVRPPPARAPLPGVSVGSPCEWQDVGIIEVTSRGVPVRCEYVNGAYLWRRPS